VVGPTLAQTTIPDDFGAFETAVNTGSPVRVEDGKLRGAFDQLAAELGVLPGGEEPEGDGGEGRGLLARLGGERGQASAEAMGLLPVLLLFVLALWQIGLIGYTYVLAGHAAQEGARMMAVNPTDGKPDDAAYKKIRARAMGEVPKPWRGGAEVNVPDDSSAVAVRLKVPVVLPGLKTPFAIGSRAATAIEDEELPPSQAITPEPVS
jgi:pilus assembly protein CpaE